MSTGDAEGPRESRRQRDGPGGDAREDAPGERSTPSRSRNTRNNARRHWALRRFGTRNGRLRVPGWRTPETTVRIDLFRVFRVRQGGGWTYSSSSSTGCASPGLDPAGVTSSWSTADTPRSISRAIVSARRSTCRSEPSP